MATKLLKIYFVAFTYLTFSIFSSMAEESHQEAKEATHSDEDEHDESDEGHSKEHGEKGKDEHGRGHANGHEEKSPDFGKGKAIVAVRDEGKSFQLSEDAIKFLKIEFSNPQFVKLPGNSKTTIQIPKSALISFQDKTGIYVSEENWIELIEVKVKKRGADQIIIEADSFDPHFVVATKGISFIRTAHLQASGMGGEGHAH